jgi:hypothetical protein
LYDKSLFWLFSSTLRIPDASIEDVIDHLKVLTDSDTADLGVAISAYEYLQRTVQKEAADKKKCRQAFDAYAMIATPVSDGSIVWKTRPQCIWKTTDLFQSNGINLRCKTVLHNVLPQLDSLEYLFQKVLQIPNAGLEEFIEELRMLQTEDSHDDSLVSRIYECIAALRNIDPKLIRSVPCMGPLLSTSDNLKVNIRAVPIDIRASWSPSTVMALPR